MERTKILAIFIAIMIFGSGLVGQNSQTLSSDDVTLRHITGIDLNNASTINALTSTLNIARVPGGVATITTCKLGRKTHDLRTSGLTLRDALDSIVLADPQYRWYVDQGVVNFVPSNGEPTLLDIVIANFKVESDKTLDGMVEELLAMPEAKEAATRLNLRQGFTEIGIRPLDRPGISKKEEKNGVLLDLRNITVREVLNAISRTRVSAVWSYEERHCKGEKEFSIRFLVQ